VIVLSEFDIERVQVGYSVRKDVVKGVKIRAAELGMPIYLLVEYALMKELNLPVNSNIEKKILTASGKQ